MLQDVLIIGGSFAGLSAAMQLVRGQRKVTVIDAGKPRNRFAKHSHGFFGLDGQSPSAIKKNMATITRLSHSTYHRSQGDWCA
ncbi:FAD-dependent oxidoreductase [Catenovulum sediminis]|uniref:FAD-dependent oxidoreductase n=1 Tax=Catenovulum sediminis TaxID=1740262 RepID=A0ABV1RE47_9ALTE|nr:FAD-dependent oxidoreductase [Catenovulum sediminis]